MESNGRKHQNCIKLLHASKFSKVLKRKFLQYDQTIIYVRSFTVSHIEICVSIEIQVCLPPVFLVVTARWVTYA